METKPDFEVAEGWLQLGNYAEAMDALDNLDLETRAHYTVLKLRCKIYRMEKRWRELSLLASGCASRFPNVCAFWMEWASAYYHQGDYAHAFVGMHRQLDRFPDSARMDTTVDCVFD
jgi:predicted Zn-dependent protease